MKKNQKCTILTIGVLRDFDSNRQIIDSFKNDSIFDLDFVGLDIAYIPLVNYVNINKIKNVFFAGWYDKKDELNYLKNISIMNILMPNDINSSTLLSNRLYLAVTNRIPILVSCKSTQAEYVEKFSLGLSIDRFSDIKVKV